MKKIIFIFIFIFSFADEIQKAYLKSYNYEKIGNYKEAIKVLMPLYSKYSKGYTLNLRLGYLFSLQKQFKISLAYYQQASNILPYSFEPKLGMMRVYMKIGEYKKVIEIGYSLLKRNYYDYYTNLYTLQSLKKLKKYKEALEIANKMLLIYPTDKLFLVNLAKIYEIIDPEYAKKIYLNSVLVLDPNNVSAKLFLDKTK